MARCRRCRAEVIWAVTERGRDIPLDYRRDEREGMDLFVVVRGIATVVKEISRAEVRAAGGRLYAPHSRFCKAAESAGAVA